MSVHYVEGDGRDVLKLRFVGAGEDGEGLHELPATQVAEVLMGLVDMAGDFGKAGALGTGPSPEVLIRPPSEGSFVIEVVTLLAENKDTAALVGVPSLSSVLWWATKSVRADVRDFDHLENGNVKVEWQDDTVDEIPLPAWNELRKRKRKRKRQLRQIMAPLGGGEATALQVSDVDGTVEPSTGGVPQEFTLERLDYHLARPEDEIEETHNVFKTEARMAAIDFDSAQRWRVSTPTVKRTVTVEDSDFLLRVDRGLAIQKNDVFDLTVREDRKIKNGRSSRAWTVLRVQGPRPRTGDVDDA